MPDLESCVYEMICQECGSELDGAIDNCECQCHELV